MHFRPPFTSFCIAIHPSAQRALHRCVHPNPPALHCNDATMRRRHQKNATPLRGGLLRWFLQRDAKAPAMSMPPPCGVDCYAGFYNPTPSAASNVNATPCGVDCYASFYNPTPSAPRQCQLPPPCGVDCYAGFYNPTPRRQQCQCHPLAGWIVTLVSTTRRQGASNVNATPLRGGLLRWFLHPPAKAPAMSMPPPCGVDSYAGFYNATPRQQQCQCHPLAGWIVTLVSTSGSQAHFIVNATPLRGGLLRWLLHPHAKRANNVNATPLRGGLLRWFLQPDAKAPAMSMPPPCGVDCYAGFYKRLASSFYCDCHRVAGWIVTLASNGARRNHFDLHANFFPFPLRPRHQKRPGRTHNTTFRIACRLIKGFHLPEEQALQLLLSEFNPRCQPPWTEQELRHKVHQASEKGQSPELLAVPKPNGKHATPPPMLPAQPKPEATS